MDTSMTNSNNFYSDSSPKTSQWEEDDNVIRKIRKQKKKVKHAKKSLKKAREKIKNQKSSLGKCKKKYKKEALSLKKALKKSKFKLRKLEKSLYQERLQYQMNNNLLQLFIAMNMSPDKLSTFKSIQKAIPESFLLEDKNHGND